MQDDDQTVAEPGARPDAPLPPRPRHWRGLSGKVLALTVLFVMVGEVLIFLPSIANYRVGWLQNRIAIAEVAALAVEAAPDQKVSDDLRKELLRGAGVTVVALKRGNSRHLMLQADGEQTIVQSYDLRQTMWIELIRDAFAVLLNGGNRLVRVVDYPPNMSGDFIEIALDETPLRAAMLTYSSNILKLSVILSIIVAALAFFAFNHVLVRPIRQLTQNMLGFARAPEDATRIIEPTARADEIGVAERELRHMQTELTGMLQQKSRLAALGLAVSKVSHDLRNMLASAQLISDRLSMVDDPTVQKFTPKLITSLDRAIDFCAQTLKFGRAEEAPPRRERFLLKPVADEVIDTAVVQASSRIVLFNDISVDVEVDADREHLFRILMNIVRNAVQALQAAPMDHEGQVRLKAWREGATVTIEISDNGPGVPEKARQHLFEAFRGSARSGGTGLGLSIANELVLAHGGEIRLLSDNRPGAVFWIVIPDRIIELHPGRRGRVEDDLAG
ncbi:MAG: HAMP domain-containing histidine kinase [Rhizobiales bacterium]|nr:HAMP domain-containing histidine kinase [Hyphomicrobiales bacterium]